MNVIEIIGIPGAGKTTLLPKLQYALRKAGVSALSSDEAIYRYFKKQYPFNLSLNLFSKSHKNEAAIKLFKNKLLGRYCQKFIQNNKELYKSIIFSIDEVCLGKDVQKELLGNCLEIGAQSEFLKDIVGRDDDIIFTDGFLTRLANFFLSSEHMIESITIHRILKLLPAINLVFYVQADTGLCIDRVVGRGKTSHLRNKSNLEVIQHMTKAKKVMDVIASFLEESGIHTIKIKNNGNLLLTESAIEKELRINKSQPVSAISGRHV